MTFSEQPTYTKHARQRQALRKVSDQEVEAVLASHHTRHPDKHDNDVLIGHPGGRRITVAVAKGSSPPRIISVGD